MWLVDKHSISKYKWPIPNMGSVFAKVNGNIDSKRRKIVLFS